MMRKQQHIRLILLIVCTFIFFNNHAFSQRARKLYQPKRKTFRKSQGNGNVRMLTGTKQLTGRFLYANGSLGGSLDMGYLFADRWIVEGGVGLQIESSGNARLFRIPFAIGTKYRLLKYSSFLLYTGVNMNANYQQLESLDSEQKPEPFVFGPSLYLEGVAYLSQTFGILLRAEQVYFLNQTFSEEDSNQPLFLATYSVGIRKTF